MAVVEKLETRESRDRRLAKAGERYRLRETFGEYIRRLSCEYVEARQTLPTSLLIGLSDFTTFRREAGAMFIQTPDSISAAKTGCVGHLCVAGALIRVIVSEQAPSGSFVLSH